MAREDPTPFTLTHFRQLHQSTILLLPTSEEAVYPGISGSSGNSNRKLSSSFLNFSILHPFKSLISLGSELNSFTEWTKKLPSLMDFSLADASRFSMGSLKERPFLLLFRRLDLYTLVPDLPTFSR